MEQIDNIVVINDNAGINAIIASAARPPPSGGLFHWRFAMPETYNPNQPRDDHGRWTEEPSASSQGYVVKDIDARMKVIIDGNKQVGESAECVALVKHLNPGIGRAADWREGPPILGYENPPLERGTAIATFTNGRYPNAVTGNHAAIFLGYGMDGNRRGIWVLDQSNRTPPQKTFKWFGGRAEHYSVIKRK